MKKVLFSGLTAGLLLYLTADFCVCLTCLDVEGSVFSAVLTAAFVLCGIIAILLYIKHRTSLKEQLLSGLLAQSAFWGLFVLDGIIGITRSFVSFPEDNYAAGLVLILVWLLCIGICVVGFVCTAVVQCIRKSTDAK